MTMPTLEQFLASVDPDEDDEPTVTTDPLTSIAESLRLLTELASRDTGDQADERLVRDLTSLDAECRKLRAENAALDAEAEENTALIVRVRELIKPSTSKLANSIRDVLDGPQVSDMPTADRAMLEEVEDEAQPPAVDPQPGQRPPGHDAPVEVWRGYAIGCGFQGNDVDSMNRSQIRTMLGIPQPTADPAAGD